jgi:hypothetical protein
MFYSAYFGSMLRFFIILGCLFALTTSVIAGNQRFVQIDVRVVGGNPFGLELTNLSGKRIKAWDTGSLDPSVMPPDPKICVGTGEAMQCVEGDCPDMYFCTFIGVPISSDTFNLEVWDGDIQSFFDSGDDLIGKGVVGINRSYNLGQAQVTITEIPCSDKEIQVNYEPKKPNEPNGRYQFDSGFESYPGDYHEFVRDSEICKTNTIGCNVNTVFSTMISQVRFVAPKDESTPVKNCMETVLDASGYLLGSDFAGASDDPVVTTVDARAFTIVNYTKVGHIFHPGKITRTVLFKGNGVVVQTKGIGYGKFGLINSTAGPYWIFAESDKRLTEAVKQRLLEKRTPTQREKSKPKVSRKTKRFDERGIHLS